MLWVALSCSCHSCPWHGLHLLPSTRVAAPTSGPRGGLPLSSGVPKAQDPRRTAVPQALGSASEPSSRLPKPGPSYGIPVCSALFLPNSLGNTASMHWEVPHASGHWDVAQSGGTGSPACRPVAAGLRPWVPRRQANPELLRWRKSPPAPLGGVVVRSVPRLPPPSPPNHTPLCSGEGELSGQRLAQVLPQV